MKMTENKIKYSIKLKFFFIIFFAIIFTSITLAFFFLTRTRSELTNELEKRGVSEATNLAYDAQYGIFTEDTVILNHLIRGRMKKHDIIYITIAREDGTILADNIKDKYTLLREDNKENLQALNRAVTDNLQQATRKLLVSSKGEKVFEFTANVLTFAEEEEEILLFSRKTDETGNPPLIRGFVKIGFSLNNIHKKVMNTFFISVFIIFIIIIIAMAISYYLMGFIVNPIKEVAEAALEISEGNLAKRVDVKSRDEVGVMAGNFNRMTLALNNTINELEHFKEALEKKVEDRTVDLKLANIKLKEANNELKAMDEMKNDFIFTVSHDFRTPLTSIVGFAKTMSDSIQEEIVDRLDMIDISTENSERFGKEINQTQKGLRIIISEGERLTRLINDMLDLSKIEAGKMEWNDENVSIVDTIYLAISAVSVLINKKGIKINVDGESFISDLFCDQDRLMQVLINLLSNAIKFSDYGGAIKFSLKNRETEVEVKIIDSGIGINQEDLQEIFLKFKQADSNLKLRSQGTGLGLPICKEIIAHYGGKIWANSELGKGSIFTFTIPSVRTSV
ncbi:MAG: ATP-binding protein [Candidatus Anammoxibacter sp.]